MTSFGLFRYLPCQWKASVSRTPSRRSRTSELVDVLADDQVEVVVERHPVALERRLPHLGHRPVERHLAADVGRHVGEVENLLLGMPDRPLREREPGRELLDTGALFDQVVDRVRVRDDSGHVRSPFETEAVGATLTRLR